MKIKKFKPKNMLVFLWFSLFKKEKINSRHKRLDLTMTEKNSIMDYTLNMTITKKCDLFDYVGNFRSENDTYRAYLVYLDKTVDLGVLLTEGLGHPITRNPVLITGEIQWLVTSLKNGSVPFSLGSLRMNSFQLCKLYELVPCRYSHTKDIFQWVYWQTPIKEDVINYKRTQASKQIGIPTNSTSIISLEEQRAKLAQEAKTALEKHDPPEPKYVPNSMFIFHRKT